jgi:hypothetical protein
VDVQHANQEDDLDGRGHAAEQVRRSRAGDDLAQDRMLDHELQALGDLRPQVPVLRRPLGSLFPDPDAEQRRHRHHVRDGVRPHRRGRAHRPHQAAAQARARELGERLGSAQLAVAVHQVLRLEQHRQVALVGHVEEHGGHPGRQRHHVQLPQHQDAERPGERNPSDDQHPRRVAGQHDPALGVPVHDRAGRQGDERERGGRGRRQQAHLEGAGLEQDHRGQRQRQLGDRRAHLADGLPAPQQHEVAMPPQAVLLPALPRRRLRFRRRRGLVRLGGLFRGLLDGGAGRLWLLPWLQQWFLPWL